MNRNVQDAKVTPAAFTLPAAASTSTTSAAIDFGADAYKNESIELAVSVPALSTTIVPDTRTVDYIFETSATSNFAAILQTQSYRQTGAGGAGVGAFEARFRAASNQARYGRFKITFGASTTDGSAISATPKVLH
jgi:hypothetical protein